MHTYISDITKSYLEVNRRWGHYTVAGTFGSHLAECWSFLHVCFIYKSWDGNSFFGIPYFKKKKGHYRS